jgi:hypothetical protein
MLFLGVALSQLTTSLFDDYDPGFYVVPLLTWERALSFSSSHAIQVMRLELRSGEGRNLAILRCSEVLRCPIELAEKFFRPNLNGHFNIP